MSDDSRSQNLGSAFSEVGFKNNREGIESFLKDTHTVEQAHQRVLKSGMQLVQAYTQQGRAQQQQAVKQTAAQATVTQRAQIAADAKVQVARVAGVARVEAAEKGATARTAAAQLAAQAKVEAARVRGLAQVEATEKRIAAQQARQASGQQYALPRTFAGFTGTGFKQALGAAGVITTVDQLIGKLQVAAVQSTELAARAETIGTAYEKSAQRAGFASDDLIKKLKTASRETVSVTELQASANKALALGVGADAQQIADLLTIARAKGKEFGLSTQQSFDDIVTGLGRVSPLILDNLGITIDLEATNARYAQSIGKTANQLTEQEKKQALVNEVLRTNQQLLQDAGDAALDNADKQARAMARQEEAMVRLGKALLPIKTGLAEGTASALEFLTGSTAEALDQTQAKALETADTYEQFAARATVAYQAVAGGASRMFQTLTGFPLPEWVANYLTGLDELTPAQYAFAKAAIAGGAATDEAMANAREFAAILALLSDEATAGDETLRKLAPDLLKVAATSLDAQRDVESLVLGYKKGTISAEELGQEVRAMGNEIGRANEEERRGAALAAQYATATKQAAVATEELKKAQQGLADEIIRAGEELQQAAEQRDNDLRDAYDRYQERVDELEERRGELAAETEDALTEAVAQGAKDRAEVLKGSADRIAEIEQDLGKRIQQLTNDHHRAVAEEEARFLREQQQARERTRTDELRGEADFIERLFDLTRGKRGGRGERAQAKQQLEAAKREAAELAKIDPEAAARLLAARERQILERIERQREEARQRRDGSRGQPGFSRQDAADEAREEGEAIAAANAAEIEQIKREAQQRADARDAETQQRQADYDAQVQQARDAASQQIAEVRENTAEQLEALDERQRERVRQIKAHAAEQQRELDKQLAKEEAAYKAARDQIQQDYAAFLGKLQATLKKEANKLQFTPDQQRQNELTQAYAQLGTLFGMEFVKALQGVMGATTITGPAFRIPGGQTNYGVVPDNVGTSGGTPPRTQTYARGSTLTSASKAAGDRILSDQAIDQIVSGGKQTDGYNGVREGGKHGGVDIAAKEGSPIKSPISGTVLRSAKNEVWGNYTIVEDANGNQHYFGHMQGSGPKSGTRVLRGDVIGFVGRTGQVTGPHVHYQLKKGGTTLVDPTAELERLAGAQPTQTAKTVTSSTQPVRMQQSVTPAPAQQFTAEPVSTAYHATQQLATLPAPAGGNPGTTVQLTVDMRGSTYGAGVDPAQVEAAARRGAQQVLAEYDAQFDRQVAQLAVGGPRKTV